MKKTIIGLYLKLQVGVCRLINSGYKRVLHLVGQLTDLPRQIIFFATALALIFGASEIDGYINPKTCTPTTINKIGACDSSGTCGVTYDNNSVGLTQYPIQGQTVCKEKIRRIKGWIF